MRVCVRARARVYVECRCCVCVRVFACVHVFAYAHVCTRVCMCACVYVNEGGGEQAGGVPGTDFCCDYSGVSQSSSALPIIQTGFLDK